LFSPSTSALFPYTTLFRSTVRTSAVVCAAGAWAANVGDWLGVHIPVRPLRRQILVSEPVPDMPRNMPFTVDFATSLYFHEEGPGDRKSTRPNSSHVSTSYA